MIETRKVYVPQVPSRFDSSAKMWVPTVDISAAGNWGKIITLLPPEANRLHAAPILSALRERMTHFSKDDCIVALGDPTIIAMTACLATQKTGGYLRMLKWDRQTSDYIMVEVRI